MPASRSRNRATERMTPAPRRWQRPVVLLAGIVGLGMVAIFNLPASLITRVLPPEIHADDFSGTLLHGAAGNVIVEARNVGAVEWRLHLSSLLHSALRADIHWVKVAFVLDGTVEVDARQVTATHIIGGGPIESLNDLGLNSGWRGAATVDFAGVSADFTRPLAAVGTITITNLQSRTLANDADLGGYVLKFAPDAIAPDGSITASIEDTGGPVAVQATVRYSPSSHLGLFSGNLGERADASPTLSAELKNLSQLRSRDAQGRFPVDLEFKL